MQSGFLFIKTHYPLLDLRANPILGPLHKEQHLQCKEHQYSLEVEQHKPRRAGLERTTVSTIHLFFFPLFPLLLQFTHHLHSNHQQHTFSSLNVPKEP